MTLESDLCACRDCGRTFNLSVVSYYTNLCPKCKRKAEDA